MTPSNVREASAGAHSQSTTPVDGHVHGGGHHGGANGTNSVNGGGNGATAASMTLHEVWHSNLEEEFVKIRELIEDYPYVAMDTVSNGFG